ncbi:hypothetical protein A3F86_03360 [candidate division WOR-1 bacterium RIFCSPLOWO2_12_FULL_45_9]|uniref:Nucleotidyl transferase domain-containing protein n=1 Tax=candidate division WOR-1 bacterium RIFCSPLOWO2_12_FULL_45_9 TaxID=1802568 RepID=A0A1F4RPE2_UNCSA|nr:MAG: hypothetical protein A3F86_03360 [candidate division WOR-1 bacterium RIFCSPLOWO2_12_FULL_45_9]
MPNKPQCVVICGGMGRRLAPLTTHKAKSMVEVKGQPIIKYIVDYWREFVGEFVFILGYGKEELLEYLKQLPIKARFIEEAGPPKGIANALLLAKPYVNDNFIVVLGDCLCSGQFVFPQEFIQGVGVWETGVADDIKRSYSVEINGQQIVRVIEKPQELINNYCGLGFYFFKKLFFDYVAKTSPSTKTNRVELTDVIQVMIDHQEKVSPVVLEGKYLNVTYPEDLERAKQVV